MGFVWLGKPPPATLLAVPNYWGWPVHGLKKLIAMHEDIAGEMLTGILEKKPTSSQRSKVVRWLAERHDDWKRQSWGILSLGRVQDVENQIGRLAVHEVMDCPPYGELLIQGFESIAVRHPEYHLVRDLALMHTLFRSAQHDANLQKPDRQTSMAPISASTVLLNLGGTELIQSLARMVILACFNLLEAFVSGLATSWVMEHPNATPDQLRQLHDNTQSLRKRLLKTVRFVTDRSDLLDEQKPPFALLFGELKCMRDAFVHCEPGETPTKWGYVKEELFHDVPVASVEKAVDCTEAIICEVWKALTGRERPTWFPRRSQEGEFPRMPVRLAVIGVAP